MDQTAIKQDAVTSNQVTRPSKRRRVLWVFAGALIAIVVFIGPWPLSWLDGGMPQLRPRVESDVNLPVAGALHVGAAKVAIDCSRLDLPLAGYGGRAFKGNAGTADLLHFRAVVLERGGNKVAFLAAELLLVNRAIVEAVDERLAKVLPAWSTKQIYFGATHTHSAPGGYPSGLAESVAIGWRDAKALEAIASGIVDAIRQAELKLEGPCEIACSSCEAPAELIRNRTVEADPANRWFDLLACRRCGDKKLIAAVGVFSAHATCRPATDLQASGDYPGVFVRKMESQTGATVAFLAGAVGSMGPGEKGGRAERAEWLGASLSTLAQSELTKLVRFEAAPTIRLSRLQIDLPPPVVKLTGALALSPLLTRTLLPRTTTLTFLRIGAGNGSCIYIGTPCDYSGVLALDLRSEGSKQGLTPIVTSFAGDYIGYTVPERYYDINRYEPRSMAFHGRNFGAALERLLETKICEFAPRH